MPRSRPLGEFAAIAQLQQIFDGHRTRRRASQPSASRSAARSPIELGIGDDAAVLKSNARLVWTVDTSVEHVHFERHWLSLRDVGWRSFQAAASDVCAMAGAPIAALSSVIFPRGFSAPELRELARGQRDAARALGCAIIGGNLARGAELSVTTTVIGEAPRPILRSGAKLGDELWLCGELGLAAAGLRLLERGANARTAAARRALAAFRRPRAELAAGLSLKRRAHALIDVSDGLCGDAAHLAHDSGVRVVLCAPLVEAALSPALRALAPELGVPALELALYGGEDYALLATGPRRSRPKGARVIGFIAAGEGVWLSSTPGTQGRRANAGPPLVRARTGFEHALGAGGRKVRPVRR
jgi:thiamine-monophosphate kinase